MNDALDFSQKLFTRAVLAILEGENSKKFPPPNIKLVDTALNMVTSVKDINIWKLNLYVIKMLIKNNY